MWCVLLIIGATILQIFDSVETTTAFNCRDSLISDEWRQMVLDDVNDKRRILAKGEQVDKTGKFLPMAKNMNQLDVSLLGNIRCEEENTKNNWDCNLEELARNGTGGACADWNANNPSSPYYASQANFKKQNCDIHSQMKILLRGWWSEVTYIVLNGTSTMSPSGADFIKMATATTKAMGCSYDVCQQKGTIVCLFDDRKAFHPRELYEGTTNKPEICDSCKNCTKFLCPQITTPVEITPTCKHDKLTRDANNAALWMHNYYRKLLASGWAKDPKAKSTYAATAKQMRELKYDCDGATNGASNTYDAIKGCPRTNPSPSPGYAMNFLRIKKYSISQQDALEHAIKTWWSQLENVGLGSDTTFNGNTAIANFANMAFDQAEKVACAVQNCIKEGETLVMCQYNRQVLTDEKIYEPGNECSGCAQIGKKCSNPRGLCVDR